MAEIKVKTGTGEYTVHIGQGVVEGVLAEDVARLRPRTIMLVSHPDIYEMYGGRLRDVLQGGEAGRVRPCHFLFPQGEENKSLKTLEDGYNALLATGVNREDLLVAFGGGVVGDLAGFMAATYMRGMPFLQVPTTLMAMVDSSIGGKVGVDMPGAKNMVGAFHQPLGVYSDVSFLRTLPERELRSGLVEVAKYGFLYDQGLLKVLEGWKGLPGEQDDITEVIAACAGHKARVVGADERDTRGERAMLNYGHTFGHALEAACGYGTLRHGEAVAVGMLMAARLAELMGFSGEGLGAYHRRVLLPILGGGARDIAPEREAVISAMRADKKKGEKLRFVLLEGLQAPFLADAVDMGAVEAAVDETLDTLRRADPCL
ncbi:MAG: 3-dehydroquinate synthase [Actinomycetota bacterium]